MRVNLKLQEETESKMPPVVNESINLMMLNVSMDLFMTAVHSSNTLSVFIPLQRYFNDVTF